MENDFTCPNTINRRPSHQSQITRQTRQTGTASQKVASPTWESDHRQTFLGLSGKRDISSLDCCPPRRHRSSKRLWRLGRTESVIESLRILTIDRGSNKKKHIGQTRPTTRYSFSYSPRSTGSCSLCTRRRHFEKNDIKALSSVCRQAKKDSAGDQVPCRRPGLPLHDLRLDRSGGRGDPVCQSPRYA
jgi:hypothetical protein